MSSDTTNRGQNCLRKVFGTITAVLAAVLVVSVGIVGVSAPAEAASIKTKVLYLDSPSSTQGASLVIYYRDSGARELAYRGYLNFTVGVAKVNNLNVYCGGRQVVFDRDRLSRGTWLGFTNNHSRQKQTCRATATLRLTDGTRLQVEGRVPIGRND